MSQDSRFKIQEGQIMLLTVLTLGGTILGATTIAGLLMIYQIRQATDIANSGKAIFAADAGIEWGEYQFFKPDPTLPLPTFANGAAVSVVTDCFDSADAPSDCASTSTTRAVIRAVGTAANVSRAFESTLTF